MVLVLARAVFNLANDIDVQATEQRLAAYYKANQEDIAMRNAMRVRNVLLFRLCGASDSRPSTAAAVRSLVGRCSLLFDRRPFRC